MYHFSLKSDFKYICYLGSVKVKEKIFINKIHSNYSLEYSFTNRK